MAVEAIGAIAMEGAGGMAKGGVRTIDLLPPGSDVGMSPVTRTTSATTPGAEVQVRFQEAMGRSSAAAPAAAAQSDGVPAPVKGLFDALDKINVQARSVSDYASTAEASGGELTPGEIVQLTMKCQEFMFQCQLTSNIANRSADGVQQLFRQQG